MGVSITQHGSTNFVSFYTYDQSGQPVWYVMSSCPVVGNGCTGDLFYVAGGKPQTIIWDGAGLAVSKVGTGTLSFKDGNNGTFDFTINGVTGSKTLTRQIFATSGTSATTDYSDLWWNQNESGWGVALTQQYGVMFVTMYTYDASGNPAWYVASNCAMSSNGCTGELYMVTGGTIPTATWNGANVVVTKVGMISFIFSDSSNGIMDYTINGITGSKAVSRQVF